jgi:uncharacterized protein (TIRG00374 family)
MSKWIGAILSVLFFVILIARLDEIERLLRVASQGIWYFLLMAFLLQGVYVANQAALYASITRLTRRPLTVRSLALPVLAANFLEVATPTPIGNVPGVALIVDQAERQGMSRAEAVLVNVLYFVLDYAAFLIVVAVGLVYLALFHKLKPYEWVAALILTTGVAMSVGVLFFAALYPKPVCGWMRRVSMTILGWWSRVRRAPPPSEERLAAFTENLMGSITLLRQGGRKLLQPLVHAFAIPSISLLMLYLIFLAFGTQVAFGVLVAGYAVGTLLVIIAITPSGLGPMEGMMILTYSSLGVTPETATLVTLVYRGFSFWLPFIAGFFALRRIR